MKQIIIYLIALMAVLYTSWAIQDFHLGLGYAVGTVGVLVAFFLTINELTKESRK